MANPFETSNIENLKEAFPSLDIPIIEDVLLAAKGDVNEASEMLLSISNDSMPIPPKLPERGNHHHRSRSHNGFRDVGNPFLNTENDDNQGPQLTVREEMNLWRQSLRNEQQYRSQSRSRLNNSTSARSLSRLFQAATSSNSSLNNRPLNQNDRISQVNGYVLQSSYQRPLNNNHSSSNSLRVPNTIRSSTSSPNVNANYQAHNNPSLSLPPRRQRPTILDNTNNPFVPNNNNNNNNNNSNNRRADAPTLNPFEVPEFPPPPYSEISADTIIYPQ